ncbi:YihY/virulence factor BrkB family protein [Phytohabitans sp. ZYX-F-186]|uniref:YihY/virulence factor BrkB family protein n=1 Tax=Phytohabitans maris TaxID=3071409 RepID=A0ABU0ZAY5_9ACTN|nr:YihY/virulence factor BrkB family protein [Phytohabitans sp. ZYX-F-186]MDQ7904195.1 YihY/virulence factor BrkB family protein [Phytohabitans sp. ZYX-F-186]
MAVTAARAGTVRRASFATWRGVLVRAVREFMDDNCTDWAAALTYYGVLSLFPAMIVIVALVGLVSDGERTVDAIVDIASDLGAGSVVNNQSVVQQIRDVTSQGSASVLLSFGLVGALWSASGYIGAFTRASNAIYEVEESRKFYKLRPLQLLITAAALVLLALVAVMLIVSGPVTDAIGDALGAGDTARLTWSILKWPVLVLVMMVLLGLMFWIAPDAERPRFRWITIGGAVTLVVWAIASFGFGLYVANFGSYGATYGTLGGVIAFLVWLYLSNCAVLLGVEINAEARRVTMPERGFAPETPG